MAETAGARRMAEDGENSAADAVLVRERVQARGAFRQQHPAQERGRQRLAAVGHLGRKCAAHCLGMAQPPVEMLSLGLIDQAARL
jgi:hypothetical protein